uniref:Uncharacterized protein n=1 Tax=Gasterosteus aculeatus TaxID=69293 RepID=G3PIC7_GASAC
MVSIQSLPEHLCTSLLNHTLSRVPQEPTGHGLQAKAPTGTSTSGRNVTGHLADAFIQSDLHHTLNPWIFHILPGEQLGVRCLAQGHFDMDHGAAWNRTTNLLLPSTPSLTPAPRRPPK